jgi:hypothetical protein
MLSWLELLINFFVACSWLSVLFLCGLNLKTVATYTEQKGWFYQELSGRLIINCENVDRASQSNGSKVTEKFMLRGEKRVCLNL